MEDEGPDEGGAPGCGVGRGRALTGGSPLCVPGTSWQGQLSSPPEALLDVDAYDLDGFDTSKATVDRIHANGGKAICYINVGSWENWRPDKGQFPKRVLGRDYYGWPG